MAKKVLTAQSQKTRKVFAQVESPWFILTSSAPNVSLPIILEHMSDSPSLKFIEQMNDLSLVFYKIPGIMFLPSWSSIEI